MEPSPAADTLTSTRSERRATPRLPARARGRPRYVLRRLGVEQVLRLAACALAIAAAGIADRAGDLLRRREERAARRRQRRERALVRAVRALGALKGPFAKAGQFASLRYDVLPDDARAAFSRLQDRVPPLGPGPVRAVIEEELGAPLESLFERFDPEPLGAASIAQVHRAVLPGGEPVAVKVQYPWLARSLPADLAVLRAAAAVAAPLRRSARAERRRLFEEFAAGLREELDFEREAAVAGEIAGNLAGEPQVVVPRVVASHSGRRVLTMTRHEAVSVRDRAGLTRLGVSPRDVVEVIGRAYAKQVFADGLFHADPHPGNLFVVDEPGAASRPRVLFVDFGLSKRLSPELRHEIRQGIFALLQRDLEGFVAGMQRLGMIAPGAEPGVRRSVSAMLERAGGGAALGLGGGQVLALKDDAKALLLETEGLRLPNDLLLYAKTLSYVFRLGAELAPDADLMRLSLPYLMQLLAERDAPAAAGGRSASAAARTGPG